MNHLSGRSVLILGLGASGLAMARWCVRHGARVQIWDSREDPPMRADLEAACPGLPLLTGTLDPAVLMDVHLVLKSPGLSPLDPQVAPLLQAAQADRVAVAAELALFARALADLEADRCYAPQVLAITGTNGKTTTTQGQPTALFGTLVNRWPGHSVTAQHTTAFADVLQPQLAQAVEAGARFAAMEVSSHSLDQQRVAGCRFAGVVFTNLTQDHLDYHPSMEAYFEAKALLFAEPLLAENGAAVVNVDDPWGRQLAERLLGQGRRCWRASLVDGEAELRIEDVTMGAAGVAGTLISPVGSGRFSSPLLGRFNLMNLLEAVGVLLQQDLPLTQLLAALDSFRGVPGRMERVRRGEAAADPAVLVDYAHTPDGLENALLACRPFCKGRLICVFGCGGDRDRSKRPLMGAIAARLSDAVVVTSDNPRTEDPQRILDDVVAGIPAGGDLQVEGDRARAIAMAIAEAGPEDLVLIAGKGHEDYQILGTEKIYFDDREQAETALRARPVQV